MEKTFKPMSTSKRAKNIIRREISHFYGPAVTNLRKTSLQSMENDAEAYHGGRPRIICLSDWEKGSALVDAGCFRCYHYDQAKFLKKIYGDKVENWTGDKIHKTYASLIGREYAAMKREAEKKTSGK